MGPHPLGQMRRRRCLFSDLTPRGHPVRIIRARQRPPQPPERALRSPVSEPRRERRLARRFIHQRRSREQRQLWEPLATFLAAHELTPRSQELFARLRHLFRVPAILREAITTLPADWPSAIFTDTDPTVGGIVRHIGRDRKSTRLNSSHANIS